MEIDLVESVSEAWASTPSVRAGVVPPHLPSADRQALVSRGGTPYLGIEVYGGRDETFAFEEVVLWSRYAVIGFGHRVHLVSLDDNSVVSQDLGSYFGHCYPTSIYLLVASAERVFRFDQTGCLAWASDVVGIDGVVVDSPEPPVIRGEGEWDPPGGWRPFALSAASGRLAT